MQEEKAAEGVAEKFESWAVVEVMGHQRYAGRVTEQAIGGCNFVRIDVPEVDKLPAFTKLLGQSSIFSITPVSRELAIEAVKRFASRPITIAGFAQQRLGFDGGDDDDYEEYGL
jgi:phage gp37-like protein